LTNTEFLFYAIYIGKEVDYMPVKKTKKVTKKATVKKGAKRRNTKVFS